MARELITASHKNCNETKKKSSKIH